jgi:hypothetical protein
MVLVLTASIVGQMFDYDPVLLTPRLSAVAPW